MKDTNKVSSGYYHSDECNLADFQEIIDQKLIYETRWYMEKKKILYLKQLKQ